METTLQKRFWAKAKKYRKLTARLNRQIQSGTFYRYSSHYRQHLLKSISKLHDWLTSFKNNWKIAGLTATCSLLTTLSFGQGNFIQNDAENPMMKRLSIGHGTPRGKLVDFDQDNDLDLITGSGSFDAVRVHYFKN